MNGLQCSLGGLAFHIGPSDRITAMDRAGLDHLGVLPFASALQPDPAGGEVYRLELCSGEPDPAAALRRLESDGPAWVEWTGQQLQVRHSTFVGVLDPQTAVGRIWRREGTSATLPMMMRVALRSRLPLCGGVPVHAAGIVIQGRAVVFFGPSGAGKSTLAGLSPFPVLSDEMVAIAGPPYRVSGTGVWGTLGPRRFPAESFPLGALVELVKGPGLRLDPLPMPAALRRLLGVLLVPAAPPLWQAALGVLGSLAKSCPLYRMTWSPAQPFWNDLLTALGVSSANAG